MYCPLRDYLKILFEKLSTVTGTVQVIVYHFEFSDCDWLNKFKGHFVLMGCLFVTFDVHTFLKIRQLDNYLYTVKSFSNKFCLSLVMNLVYAFLIWTNTWAYRYGPGTLFAQSVIISVRTDLKCRVRNADWSEWEFSTDFHLSGNSATQIKFK